MLIMRGLGDYTAAQPGGASVGVTQQTAYNPGPSPGNTGFAPSSSVAQTSSSGPGGVAFAPAAEASNVAFVPAPRTYTRDGKTYTSGNVFVPGPQSGGPAGPANEAAAGGVSKGQPSSTWKWLIGAAVVAGGYYWWTNR